MIQIVFVVVAMAAVADEPRTLQDYIGDPQFVGTATINAAMPRQVLTERDVERWGNVLDASDAQQHFFLLQYKQFVETHNAFMDREIPAYLEESQDVEALSAAMNDRFVAAMRSLQQRTVRLTRELESLEHQLIDSLAAVLADEQLQRLDILRWEATRRQADTFHNSVRGSDLDLRALWRNVDALHLSPEQIERVEATLYQYEAAWTPLAVQLSTAYWNRPLRVVPLLIKYRAGQISERRFSDAYQRIHERYLDTGRHIRRLALDAVQDISEVASDRAAIQFQELVNVQMYPEIYPDRESLKPLLDAVVADSELSVENVARVEASVQAYLQRYSGLCETLESRCLEWSDGEARGDGEYRPQGLKRELKPLLEQRQQLARSALEDIQMIVGESRMERYAKVVPQFNEIEQDAEEPWIPEDHPKFR